MNLTRWISQKQIQIIFHFEKNINLDFVLYGPFYIIGPMSALVTSWKKCVSIILILYFQKFYGIFLIRLSDEMLNQGPDSLWSLKIPWHFSLRVGVYPWCPGQIPTTGPCQSWPPNNPHPLDWLYLSLSSPPVAGVWWAHWRRRPVAAVASTTPHPPIWL